jgi:hypothetical protein
MPPLTGLLEKGTVTLLLCLGIIFLLIFITEDGDDSDEDDDLEMGGVTLNFNCPLTLTPLVNPVTS